ncbi:MAG TPA: PKD domain-containing protein [Thermoanaerobaculia bacterium]
MLRRLFFLASILLPALACNSTNPVEPPPPGGSGNGSGTVLVSIKSDRGQVEAGSVAGANLTVTASENGAPVADGTEVTLSTNLGSFGVDGAGKPLQLVKKTLSGGSATAPFYAASSDLGTANILAQVGTSVGKVNLPIVAASAPPMADFSFQVSALSVLFQDASTGTPTSWTWDFGDGATTMKQNPAHSYAVAGTYTVSLTVMNASGQSSTKRQFVTVTAGDPLLAAFTFSASGLKVLFMDASIGTPTSWVWHFGDGSGPVSTRNPSHTYAAAGTYTVTLTVTNAFGVSAGTSQFVTVSLGSPPAADFTFQSSGLNVAFLDASTGSPTSWSWDFGDGSSSTAQNPRHTYAAAGTYNVTLTATNSAGSSSKTKLVTVSQGDPPVADFAFQATGLSVAFADQSTGNPTSWSWDFGDGSKSTQQNPSHTYAKAGTYAVVLTASNAAGSGSKTKLVTVTATKPPVAAFCYQRNKLQVVFTDTSSNSPTSWQWDFGDCVSPASCLVFSQNPSHTYAAAGAYTVTLTVSNEGGQSTLSKVVTVDTSTVDPSPVCN